MKPRTLALFTLCISGLLAGITLLAGIYSGSRGLVSDGIHAAGDVLSSLLVLLGVCRQGCKGERRAMLGLGCLMLLSGAVLGLGAVQSLFRKSAQCPAPLAAKAEGAALLIRLGLWRYTARRGRECESRMLCANARHLAADVLTSGAVLLGAVFSEFGAGCADSAAALPVSAATLWMGVRVIRHAGGPTGEKKRKKT